MGAGAERLGYSPDGLRDVVRRAVALVEELRSEHADERMPIVVCGVVGPRGDGYSADEQRTSSRTAPPWLTRIGGLRANASTKSHAELDEAEELDAGDPADLGARYGALRRRLPNVSVVGGCRGTDERHIAEICKAWPGSRPA